MNSTFQQNQNEPHSRKTLPRRLRLGTIVLLILVVSHASSAQGTDNLIKLSLGPVESYQITPDGTRVVYRADQNRNDVFELFSVAITGGTPLRLNADLVAGGDVSENFEISPDGSRVVYRADQNRNDRGELFSVAITGGVPLRLNADLPDGGDVSSSFQISPDGSRVVYRADQNRKDRNELFSVAITGGTPLRLNANLVASGDVDFGFEISPDGSRVLYRADQIRDDVFELFSVAINGGAPVRLNADLPSGGNVASRDFRFSPDGTLVVYRADQNRDNVFELFSVPTIGGTPIRLNTNLPSGGTVSGRFSLSTSFLFSPDGKRVVYRASQNRESEFELFSVTATGGTPVRLHPRLPDGGDVDDLGQISPDGTRVVYLADQNRDELFELFSVDIAGGIPLRLNTALPAGGDVFSDFKISANGSRVVYRAEQNRDGRAELFSVAIMGGEPLRLNADLVAGGDVPGTKFEISPDGSRVVYMADQFINDVFELFSVGIMGDTPLRLNSDLALNGDVLDFQISGDSQFIVYEASLDANQVEGELFAKALNDDEFCVPIKASNNKIAVICF